MNALQYYKKANPNSNYQQYIDSLGYLNMSFTVIFSIESVLKILAFGPKVCTGLLVTSLFFSLGAYFLTRQKQTRLGVCWEFEFLHYCDDKCRFLFPGKKSVDFYFQDINEASGTFSYLNYFKSLNDWNIIVIVHSFAQTNYFEESFLQIVSQLYLKSALIILFHIVSIPVHLMLLTWLYGTNPVYYT